MRTIIILSDDQMELSYWDEFFKKLHIPNIRVTHATHEKFIFTECVQGDVVLIVIGSEYMLKKFTSESSLLKAFEFLKKAKIQRTGGTKVIGQRKKGTVHKSRISEGFELLSKFQHSILDICFDESIDTRAHIEQIIPHKTHVNEKNRPRTEGAI